VTRVGLVVSVTGTSHMGNGTGGFSAGLSLVLFNAMAVRSHHTIRTRAGRFDAVPFGMMCGVGINKYCLFLISVVFICSDEWDKALISMRATAPY
jgi:hypothetical protein